MTASALLRAVACLGATLIACGGSSPAPDGATDAAVDASPDGASDAAIPPSRAASTPLTGWVDPFIGTGGIAFGYASCYPGPQAPFGMVRPGPDTTLPDGAPGVTHFSGYNYSDPMIQGFSHTRVHGTGAVDMGAVALMPTDGMSVARADQDGYRSAFDKADEEASPGYYSVLLGDTGIDVELTATRRVAVHRYSFPATVEPVVVVDAAHHIGEVEVLGGAVTVDAAANEVSGFSHISGGLSRRHGGEVVYFVARFDRPFSAHGVFEADELFGGDSVREGVEVGAWLEFADAAGQEVQAAVAVSFVDVAHARMNLEAEMATIDFDGARAATEAAWESALGVVEVEGRSERDFTIFYTAIYHMLMMPTLASDVDGMYRGIDGEVHTADFDYYTDFSLWDTFRTLHPALVLLFPDYQRDFLRSLERMAEDGGHMPRWPMGAGYTGSMVGESATVVFADSWLKGLRDFDLRGVYDAMRGTAMAVVPSEHDYSGRSGLEEYMALGYVPMEATSGSASKTLEYAYNDFALATLADALGEVEDVTLFEQRAGYWRPLYDEDTHFLLGRSAAGLFPTDIDALRWQDFYVEGNAWQYMWYVPHDLEGLAEVHGGRDVFLGRLEQFFGDSSVRRIVTDFPSTFYWHGNEPDLHATWIFSSLDQPEASARWTRWALDQHYDETPAGLPGNDDGGTMSAWYVFTSLGFYSIAGTEHYLVGSPIFTRATLHLEGGDFVIEAPLSSEEAIFVQDAVLDGEALTRARFSHAAIADGGLLTLTMGAEANDWGLPE